jgi:hypothetical protein
VSGLHKAVEPFPGAPIAPINSGHIAYAWEHRGVVYHITIHGHANEPRVALMMAAFIKRVTSRYASARARSRLAIRTEPLAACFTADRPRNGVEPLRLT